MTLMFATAHTSSVLLEPTLKKKRLKENGVDLHVAHQMPGSERAEQEEADEASSTEREAEEASTAPTESEAETYAGLEAEAEAEIEAQVEAEAKLEAEPEANTEGLAAETKSEVGAGLPTLEELACAAVPEAAFRQICKWVHRQQRHGRLSKVGVLLAAEHRRCILSFLISEVLRNPACQLKGRAVLRQLAAVEPWCCEGTLDQESMYSALSGAQLLGACPAPWTGPTLPRVPPELRQAAVQPDTALPCQAMLRDADADRGELMSELCAWIAASRRSGSLGAEVAALHREHRQAIVTFAVPGARYEQVQSYAMRMLPSMSKRIALRRKAAGLSSQGRSRTAAPAAAELQSISHEQFYVLQGLAEVAEVLFERPEDPNLALLTRALAKLPS